MQSLLQNPIFIGGVIPMLIFGVFNFLYKPISLRVPLLVLLFGITFGALLTVFALNGFSAEKSLILELKSNFKPIYAGGLLLGLLWAVAVYCMGISLGKLGGNASQIIPIVNANTILTVLLVLVFTPEPIIVWKVLLGAVLIVVGSILLL